MFKNDEQVASNNLILYDEDLKLKNILGYLFRQIVKRNLEISSRNILLLVYYIVYKFEE